MQCAKYSYYPSHPANVVVKPNDFYSKGLTEKDVWEYYNKVKSRLLPHLRDRVVMLVLGVDGTAYKRYHEKKPIRIREIEDFQLHNNGRTLEFHMVTGKYTDIGWVDLDPGEKFSLSKTKDVTREIMEALPRHVSMRNLKLKFSGGTGFHLYFDVTRRDVDKLRAELRDFLRDYILEKGDETLTTSVKKSPNMIRLDVTTLHNTGSIRAPYSLNATTGLVSLPLAKSELDGFRYEDAKIDHVVKKSHTETFYIYGEKVKSFEGRFVIQEHDAERAGKHYDLRLEIPKTWVDGVDEYEKKRSPKTPEPRYKGEDTVLLSFAIPKHRLPREGERLLAIRTELHPIGYLSFEGVIPEGYGKGRMRIVESGKMRVKSFAEDRIRFELKKPDRSFYLVRTDDNRWLIGRSKEKTGHRLQRLFAQTSSLQHWDFNYRDINPGDMGTYFDPSIDIEYERPFKRLVIVPQEIRQILTVPVQEG